MQTLDPEQVEDILSLTEMQKGLLFHDLAGTPEGSYHEQLTIELEAPADVHALRLSFDLLVRRHAALRTVFRWEEVAEPLQIILGDAPAAVATVDAAALQAPGCEGFTTPFGVVIPPILSRGAGRDNDLSTILEKLREADLAHRFDLRQAPLRAYVVTAGHEAALLLSHHHILLDGWSSSLLVEELLAGYAALRSGEEPPSLPPTSPKPLILHLQSLNSSRAEEFWDSYLEGARPSHLPRPAGEDCGPRLHRAELRWPTAWAARLSEVCSRYKVTPAACFLAAWGLLLQRWTGSRDVLTGYTVSGRGVTVEGIERTVGMFANTLVLRVAAAGDVRAADLLQAVQRDLLAHSELEHSSLASAHRRVLGSERGELFDSLVVVENYPVSREEAKRAGLHSVRIDEQTHYPVTLTVGHEERWTCQLAARGRGDDSRRAEILLEHWRWLLEQMLENPRAPLRSLANLRSQRARDLLAAVHREVRECPPAEPTVVAGFFEAARSWPERVALVDRGERLSYADLARRVEELAQALVARGVQPGDFVAVRTERNATTVIALLAVARSGAAFVPLSKDAPPGRAAAIARSCALSLELVQEPTVGGTPCPQLDIRQVGARADGATELPAVSASSIAYVYHTSGSTGLPKGIVGCQQGLSRLVKGENLLRAGEGEAVLLTSAFVFDVSIFTIFSTLLAGGKLVLPTEHEILDADEMERWIHQEGITHVWLITPLFNSHVASGATFFRHLRRVVVGGAPMSAEHVRRLHQRSPGLEIVNTYGTTECGVWSTEHLVGAEVPERIPIGRPLPGTLLYVLDADGHLLPPGAMGELALGGVGVGVGYLGKAVLTAERFVPDPFGGSGRMFLTGDRVRWLPDLTVDFLGRRDRQVKIRGNRVDVGEVEQRLLRCAGVREVAVTTSGAGDDLALVACLVAEQRIEPAELLEYLRRYLPDYMLPSQIRMVEEIPRLATGKADLRRLAALVGTAPVTPRRRAPATGLEQEVAVVWCEVLGVEQVDHDSPFFAQGGDSLQLIKLQSLIHRRLQRRLSIAELFRYPSVRTLARFISGDAEPIRGAAQYSRSDVVAREEPIAVIGMAGRFPGAHSIDEMWEILLRRGEGIRRFQREELLAFGERPQRLDDPRYVPAKGVLDDVEWFEGELFGYSSRECEVMDPQVRLLHECCWDTLEDAACDHTSYPGRIGIYVGLLSNPAWWSSIGSPMVEEPEAYAAAVLNVHSVASLVAHALNLTGPALTVDTACSTSAVAIHLACQALWRGECELALAGGVSIEMPIHRGYLHTEGMIYSSDGHCRAFDAGADGTVIADGVGMVALKSLGRALADRDRIYAVVKGSAVNNDGDRKVGYTAPSVVGQLEAISACHRQACFAPASLGLIEAHGTGTRLGDPIEIEALKLALGEAEQPGCAIGSIKSNLGHLNRAAGVAGFIKVCLALYRHCLPPTANFSRLNPEISLQGTPLYVNTEARTWPAAGGPRRAAVSSFGIGGTNAHLALEEPAAQPETVGQGPRQVHLITFSAPSPEQLWRRIVTTMEGASLGGVALADLAFTLQVGRAAFPHRRAFLLDGEAAEVPPEAVLWTLPSVEGQCEEGAPECAFLFPGQGARDDGLPRRLYREEGEFRALVDRSLSQLAVHADFDVSRLLSGDAALLRQTRFAQPWIFVVDHALASLLQRWGVRPACMIGHSLGEYVAACVAGVFSLEDALRIVALRGRLMQAMPPGRMLSLMLNEEEARRFLDGHPGMELTAVNSGRSCVIAGPPEATAGVVADLEAKGVAVIGLHTSHAFHTRSMEPMLADLEEALRGISLQPPAIPFVSNVTGTWITAEQAVDPHYWARQARRTVLFHKGLAALLAAPRILLEVGPGKALSDFARRHGRYREQAVLPLLTRARAGAHELSSLYRAVAALWTAGAPVDWAAYNEDRPGRRVSLPGYPWSGRRFWQFGARVEGAGPGARAVRAPHRAWVRRAAWQPQESAAARTSSLQGQPVLVCGTDSPEVVRLAEELASMGARCATVLPPSARQGAGAEPPSVPETPWWQLDERLGREETEPPHVVFLCPSASGDLGRLADEMPWSLAFFQHLLASRRAPASLCVLAGGAFRVLPGDEVSPLASAAAATTASLGSVLPPAVRVSCADAVSSRDQVQAVADTLSTCGAGGGAVAACAYRLGRRYHRTFVPILPGSPRSGSTLHPHPVFWILAGGGELAGRIAADLSRCCGGAAIVGADSPPAHGSDPRHPAQVERSVSAILDRYGRLDGVLLAGGAEADFERTSEAPRSAGGELGATTRGVLTLLSDLERRGVLTPRLHLLFCSSLDVLTGTGQLDQALGNGFLDGLAQHCRDRWGVQAVSVGWDRGIPGRGRGDAGGSAVVQADSGFSEEEFTRLATRLLTGSCPWAHVVASPRRFDEILPMAAGASEAVDPAGGRMRPRPAVSSDYRPPRNPAERELVALFEEYLGVSPVGVDDSYFELGATSLDVIQIRERLAKQYPEVSVVDLFDQPTIAALAAAGLGRGGSSHPTEAAQPPAAEAPLRRCAGVRSAASSAAGQPLAGAAVAPGGECALLELVAERRAASREPPGSRSASVPRHPRAPRFERGLVRAFYDSISRRLDATSYGPFSRFLNYGYVADGSREYAPVDLPPNCLNRSSIKLVLEVLGDCPLGPENALLDVGCGRGGAISVLRELFQVGPLTGVDLSPQAIEFCTRAEIGALGPATCFLVADAQSLPFEERSFDRLLSIESSHHYEDLPVFYREVYRVLEPGGLFLYADMFPVAQVAEGLEILQDLGFVLEHRRDITGNVLRSCDQSAEGHAQAFGLAADDELMGAFLGRPGSENYQALSHREVLYLVLRVRRPRRSGAGG